MSDIDAIKEYVAMRDRQRQLKADHDSVKDRADAMEQELLEQFSSNSIDRMTVDGHTVYLHRQTWAHAAEGADIVAALKDAGLAHMVAERVNSSTLSAYVRELQREGEDLPEALADKVSTTDRFSLRVRRAG